ncbi:NADP-dependent phosphogluconate dehydrogenase [Kordia algicida OT-1]|uniref:NADP-dependent phosphogluconate dehydrogenase n=1 Tax=Kordia algicida TaxID=221066 RepID=UPI003D9BAC0C
MKTKIIFIIGVSGVGKSTVANLLSKKLQVPFFDGDDFHHEKNIKKMASGTPLNDADRYDWLQSLNELAIKHVKAKTSCIIVCSALKQAYRDILSHQIEKYSEWVFLHGSFDQIKKRLDNRKNHFMSSELLKSQFDTLEEPTNAIKINVEKSPEHIVEIIKNLSNNKSEFGLFGLGVMGKSLSRNLANNGVKLSLFNRHIAGKEENIALNFKKEFPELATALPFDDIAAFVNSIQQPRKIMLMVNAGKTIDLVIENLLPYLTKGDILIDGGNSNYNKTKERHDYLKSKNIYFIGAGVSGGEEGALRGPSIMPGGNEETYKKIQPFLEKIAAKDENKLPCCSYIGPEGSGHFVKMVHNGIEYAEMQLLAEVFTLLKNLGKNPDEIAAILESWKAIENSYLLEITIDILRKKDGEDWLIHKIMDKAGNKGTGNWTTIATAQLGIPSTMVASSLFARYISFFKEERITVSTYFNTNDLSLNLNSEEILKAYQFARIINHYQGFKLIKEASNRNNWNINLSELARIWTNGCIIRSDLMTSLVTTFKTVDNILHEPEIIEKLQALKPFIKKVVTEGIVNEVAVSDINGCNKFLK